MKGIKYMRIVSVRSDGVYSKIMNDPSWIVAQHMKGFENLHLDDVDKKKDIVNVSGTIIFEIVNK